MTLQLEDKKKKELKLAPITHTLLHPITVDGTEILEVTFKPMTFADYTQVDVDQDDEDVIVEAFCLILTELSDKAFNLVSSPDFNSLKVKVKNMILQRSPDWLPGLDVRSDFIPLALPIKGDDGRDIKEIRLNVPSVKTRKIYKTQKTDALKQAFITQACSGLSESETTQLFMPDWNELQARINDFLNKQAGYFQSEM